MKEKLKDIHRGQVLYQVANAYPGSIKDMVERTGYKYGTFFKHIKIKDLSYSILAKYGKAMNRDFSTEFPEMADMPFYVPVIKNSEELSIEQLKTSLQEYQDKYNRLLEKQNSTLEMLFTAREEVRMLKDENMSLKRDK